MTPRYLTASLPGTGGVCKDAPEDFVVEEIPLYLPCGEGEHLFLEVEKRGITTLEMLHRLCRALGVKEREAGYAGLKDARAVSRQTVSLPGVLPAQALALELAGIRVLSARLHRNKLRLGHLKGNRFRIRLRQVGPDALDRALDILAVLRDIGVPNRFGAQRYGSLGNSAAVGRALLRGDFAAAVREIIGDPEKIHNERWREGARRFAAGDLAGALAALPARMRDERGLVRTLSEGRSPRQAVLGLPRKLLRLYLSAYQSELFDRVVDMRLATLEVLWPGDLAYKHDNGACFLVADAAAEQPRADRFEISASGPMFGYKMTLAKGQAGLLEESLLASEGLELGNFRLGEGLSMEGERRPLRAPLWEPEARQEGEDIGLVFALPRGSYATSVLREIQKDDGSGEPPFPVEAEGDE